MCRLGLNRRRGRALMFSTFSELTLKFGSIFFIITQTAPRSDTVAPHAPPLAFARLFCIRYLPSALPLAAASCAAPHVYGPVVRAIFKRCPQLYQELHWVLTVLTMARIKRDFVGKQSLGALVVYTQQNAGLWLNRMNRTGRPPILDTATSLRSDVDSTGPSGIPKNTDVSVRITSSSSSSDQSCRVDDAIAESLVYQPGMTVAMSP